MSDVCSSDLSGELTINFVTSNFSLDESVEGTVNVTPNPDSDVDQTLTIEATAVNGAGSATDTEDSVISVDADADGAEGGAGDDLDSLHLSVSASVADGGDGGGSFQQEEIGTLNVVATFAQERKSVGSGKGVSVRVDSEGRRISKKKKKRT